MPTVYRRTNTNSDLTGGTDFNKALLLPADDTTGSQTVTVPQSSTRDSFAFTAAGVPGVDGLTGNYVVGMEVVTAQNDIFMSCAVARVNSAGVQQAISAFATEQQATAGVHDFTFTGINLGTWAAGDRLRVTFRYRNNHAHSSRDITVSHGGVNNEVNAPWGASDVTVGLTGVSSAGIVQALGGAAIARALPGVPQSVGRAGLIRGTGGTMNISSVGFNSANANTVTLPSGSTAGDLAIVTTGRSNASGSGIPGGWTDLGVISTAASTAHEYAQRVGWKLLQAADITAGNVGTWTNAADIQVLVLRGAGAVHETNHGGLAGVNNDIHIPPCNVIKEDSWVVGVGTHRTQTGTALTDAVLNGYVTHSTGGTSARHWCGTSPTSVDVFRTIEGLATTSRCGRSMEVLPSYTVGIAGVASTGSAGTVAPSVSGDVTRALTGVATTGSVGTVSADGGDAVPGDPYQITHGIGTPASIGRFILVGLSPAAADDAISASLAATLDGLVGDISTSVLVAGAAAQTLADAEVAGAVSVETAATLEATLDDAAVASSGAVDVQAEVVQTLAAAALNAEAIVVAGSTAELDATLDDATLAAASTVAIDADVATTLDSLAGDISASVSLSGATAQTLADAQLTGATSVLVSGETEHTLTDAVLAGEVSVEVSAALATTLGEATLAATSVAGVAGALAQSLDGAAVASSGTVDVEAEVAQALQNVALSAETIVIAGTIAEVDATLAAATLASAGTVDISGEVSAQLGEATSEASGSVSLSGALSAQLDPAVLAADTGVGVGAQLTASLDELSGASAGTVPVSASAEATLGAVAGQAEAAVDVHGAVEATLGAVSLESEATAVSGISAALDATLDGAALQSEVTVIDSVLAELDATLDDATAQGAATVAVAAEVMSQLGDMAAGASGAVSVSAHAAPTLDDAVLAAAGSVDTQGAVDAVLAGLAGDITAGVGVTGQAEQELEGLTGTAAAGAGVAGQVAAQLAELALVATAQSVDFIEAPSLAFASRAGSRRLFGAGAAAAGVSGNAAGDDKPGESSVQPVHGVGGKVIR